MPPDNRQEAASKDYAIELQMLGVFILTTCVQGSLMAAAYTTRESAMEAAVHWAEGEAETILSGSLGKQYEQAWRHVEGQGGQMEIIVALVFKEA